MVGASMGKKLMLQGERNGSHCTFLRSQSDVILSGWSLSTVSSFPLRKCDDKSSKTDQTTRALVDNPREAAKTKEVVPGH